jgi:hypothetical protein
MLRIARNFRKDAIRLMRNKKEYRKFEWLKVKQLLSKNRKEKQQLNRVEKMILNFFLSFKTVHETFILHGS